MIEEEVEVKKPRTILRVRVSAIIETLVFLAILLFIDLIFGGQNRFTDIRPHPFWIIVLIVSVQYGTAEGVVAALLSTIVLYAGFMPELKFDESLFDYRVRLALSPTLWLVAALVLGEMRMRVEREREKYKKQALEAEKKAEKITENYEDLKDKKEGIEVRLASQMRSIAFTYRALRHLESMNPGHILLSITDMVSEIIGPEKFSIYSFSPDGFEAMVCEGWNEGDNYARRFPPQHSLYRAVTTRKGVVCVINEDDAKDLEGEGLLAAPILEAESGEIFGMLKIEEIDFTNLNISNLELVQTLCELVGAAFANAQKYHRLERHSIYATAEEDAYSHFFYKLNNEKLRELLAKTDKPLSEVIVKIEPQKGRADEEFMKHRSSLVRILKTSLSNCDSLYQMGRDELHFSLLLPLTTHDEAESKKKKIEHQLAEDPFLSRQRVDIKSKRIETKAVKHA